MNNVEKMKKDVKESRSLLDLWNGNALYGFGIIARKCGMGNISNVFHYTDIRGFINIMQNQELWASQIYFMNDRSEYHYGKKMFQMALTSLEEKSRDDLEKQLYRMTKNSLDKSFSEGFFPISSRDVFSLSFSRCEDSLEMWRGYGKQSGIAIGFDMKKISGVSSGAVLIKSEKYEYLLDKYHKETEKICPEGEQLFMLYNVLYDKNDKEQFIREMVNCGVDFLKRKQETMNQNALDMSVRFLSSMIFLSIPFFKHEGFKGEEECRFVECFEETIKKNNIHFRERNGIILPYIKYKIVDRNCRPLREMPVAKIVVGPGINQMKTMESVKYFLDKIGMENLVEKVQLSEIPYVSV